MKSGDNALHFFLGANTPQGFVSRFDQLADEDSGWRKLVIKGGPGSGKSTMMKKVVEKFGGDEENMEIIHCSSDVDSLDGVILPGRKCCIADGTSPHVIEPKFPGAVESIVDITGCWDDDMLFGCREEIISTARRCSSCHEYCCRFLSAAGSLTGDTYRLALECVNTAKLAAYCGRVAEREFKPQPGRQGKEKVRFLSAVTNKGVVSFVDTAKKLCERIYLVNDDYGAVSRLLLQSMRSKALAAGYDVISCYCPLAPFDKLEQLFIPSLKVGWMTSNRFHDFTMEIDPYRIVNSQRFTEAEKLKGYKKRMNFNRKAAAQMISQAEELLREAKDSHDELEQYYVSATDFSKVDALSHKVLEKISRY